MLKNKVIDRSFKVTLLEYSIPFEKEFYLFIKNYSLKKFVYNSNSYFDDLNVKEKLKVKINKYIIDIANEHRATLCSAWIQKYSKNQFHEVHTHGSGDFLSFVWYIDCTKNSSKTIFHNQGYPYVDTHGVEITPEKNKLILFDGTIPHYVLPNKDTRRLIISGNLKKWQKQ
jgi:hypothetical protein